MYVPLIRYGAGGLAHEHECWKPARSGSFPAGEQNEQRRETLDHGDPSRASVDAAESKQESVRAASARGRNRTCKGLPPRDFKSLAFTNFATRAANTANG